MKRISLVGTALSLIFVALLLVGTVCSADIIDIPPDSALSGFGSSQVYRGQTFHLPPGPSILANRLTVFVGSTADVGANFRVLITELDMTDGFHPTNVIFESATMNVPILPFRRGPDTFVIDLGGLPFEPDRDYAWILDHFVVGDPETVVSMGTGLGTYSDGVAFRLPNGPFFPPGTREDHFASNDWLVEYDMDFAFRLEFMAVITHIAVNDSVLPDNDFQIPFPDITVGNSMDATVTVANNGTADLVIGTIDTLAAPFSIPAANDGCSGQTLANSESCTFTVRFSPTVNGSFNDSLSIPSNDPVENPVLLHVSGTGLLGANNPPSAPQLVYPADEQNVSSTTVRFGWHPSTDPEGDLVTYDIFVCTDSSFQTCPAPINSTPITASAFPRGEAYALASGLGLLLIGMVFAGGIGRRKIVALLLILLVVAGVFLISCSGNDTAHGNDEITYTVTNLDPGTTHFWKVVATDGKASTHSHTRSFTTNQ